MRTAPWHRPSTVLVVAVGGAAGTAVRYLAVEAGGSASGWPWPVFLVNLAGSFVLGWLVEALPGHERVRLLAGVGFCGGLTTYSTFAVEVAGFARDDRLALSVGYLVASVLGGLACAAGGLRLGRRGPAGPRGATRRTA